MLETLAPHLHHCCLHLLSFIPHSAFHFTAHAFSANHNIVCVCCPNSHPQTVHLVDVFYSLVTDMYEWGVSASSPRHPGEVIAGFAAYCILGLAPSGMCSPHGRTLTTCEDSLLAARACVERCQALQGLCERNVNAQECVSMNT